MEDRLLSARSVARVYARLPEVFLPPGLLLETGADKQAEGSTYGVKLSPGSKKEGYFAILAGPSTDFHYGETLPLTLTFERAGQIPVNVKMSPKLRGRISYSGGNGRTPADKVVLEGVRDFSEARDAIYKWTDLQGGATGDIWVLWPTGMQKPVIALVDRKATEPVGLGQPIEKFGIFFFDSNIPDVPHLSGPGWHANISKSEMVWRPK
jgi:hypothetical protein